MFNITELHFKKTLKQLNKKNIVTIDKDYVENQYKKISKIFVLSISVIILSFIIIFLIIFYSEKNIIIIKITFFLIVLINFIVLIPLIFNLFSKVILSSQKLGYLLFAYIFTILAFTYLNIFICEYLTLNHGFVSDIYDKKTPSFFLWYEYLFYSIGTITTFGYVDYVPSNNSVLLYISTYLEVFLGLILVVIGVSAIFTYKDNDSEILFAIKEISKNIDKDLTTK